MRRNKKTERKSPQEYKSKRETEFDIEEVPEKYSVLNIIPNDIRFIPLDPIGLVSEIDFTSIIINKNDNINLNEKFQSMLCDLEFFTWSKSHSHVEKLWYLTDLIINDMYSNYLCKTFGNDITRYGFTKISINDITKKYYNVDEIWTFSGYKYLRNTLRIGTFLGVNIPNPSFKTTNPLVICKFQKDNTYGGLYSNQILKSTTRYTIIPCIILYIKEDDKTPEDSHYTFLFVDFKEKLIDYYDPHGFSGEVEQYSFVYKSLQKLYPGFKINEFWKTQGLQSVENIEEEEEGFCVFWSHIMMHLKLLNMNMSINDIEVKFIEECNKKSLSLYEIMLNYGYYMRRVIPQDFYNKKILKLGEVLKL
jgi:hypothetical protein